MSVHDEIMTALCLVEMGEGYDESRFGWRHHADAIMPIVERVAREAAQLAISDRHSEAQEQAIIDDIVRRVCGE